MSLIDDRNLARAALNDAATSDEDLLTITTHHQDLWVEVAKHPNAYPGLLAHIEQYGDEAVHEALRQREAREAATAIMDPMAYPEQAAFPAVSFEPPAAFDPATHSESSPWALTPSPTSEGSASPSADGESGEKSSKKKPIIIGSVLGGLVLLAGIGVAVFFFVIQPSMLNKDFDTAVEEYGTARDALTTAVADATESLEITEADQLKDPLLHEALAAEIVSATPHIEDKTPAKASSTGETKLQIATLEETTAVVQKATETLSAKTLQVDESRMEYLGELLSAAIEEAQAVYESSEGLVKEEANRIALKEVIDSALQTRTTFNLMERTTMVESVDASLGELKEAISVIKTSQQTKCPGGVLLPNGIDNVVCEGMPYSATTPRVQGQYMTFTQFSTPNGNIGCTTDAYGPGMVFCETKNQSWSLPGDITPEKPVTGGSVAPILSNGTVSGQWYGDVPPWANNKSEGLSIPTLAEGTVANMGDVACRSQDEGVLCWDTSTHHGFFMNSREFTYW
ncbi:MAG: hypothetical protein FWG15_07930 [Propionibacteriaceae bacterium]|nr:hypothetical protein [Propionibacteriaceae bacterium]